MVVRRALERSGDHDLYVNFCMYQPEHVSKLLRSCDQDSLDLPYPSLVCLRCTKILVLFEAARRVPKHSRFTVGLAEREGCPVYVLNHNGKLLKLDGSDRMPASYFQLIDPRTGTTHEFTGECPEQELCDFLEKTCALHFEKDCARFRKIPPV
jgi:hypothetical protein